jgi:pentatricopeptide repeat protein
MKAYGIKPNEITYCCILSTASKGFAGDVAVTILREMQTSGFSPNILCYACAITACTKCKQWDIVEGLFNELYALNMVLPESVIISAINLCRYSVYPPKFKGERRPNEWAKAIWLLNMWVSRVNGVSESAYTMVMDVCIDAGQYRHAVDLYFQMEKRAGQLETKSAVIFALKGEC